MSSVQIEVLKGKEVLPYLSDLATLRISEFKNYPYLYDGNIEREGEYLSTYAKCKDFVMLVMLDQEKVIGATTGLPMKEEDDDFKAAFDGAKYDINDIFYIGETIILPQYRNKGLSRRMLKKIEQQAKDQGYRLLSLATINRSSDDIRQPKDYISVDGLWQKYGYEKQADIKASLSWCEVGQSEETIQEMIFWLKFHH